MNLIQRLLGIVKASNAIGWTSASITRADKRSEGKPPPFTQDGAVRMYGSWVYAAASINANAVASQPLRLYIRSRKGAKSLWKTRRADGLQRRYLLGDLAQTPSITVLRKVAEIGADFEEVTDDHPLLRLLAMSNPYCNGFDATVLRVVWQELTGNAYFHVVTDPALGIPSELWPMPPQWTRILTDEREFVSGYVYGVERGSEQKFAPDEVIHFKRPNPKDLWYGMGKLEAAWGAANANRALHEMDLAMFENHARPDWLAVVKGNPDPNEIDRFEEKVREQLRGTRRAGSFLVTSADIDIKAMQFPTKDITGREDVVEEIAAVFGVPISMLKANDPNLASATTGFAQWRESTILPLCRMDEEVLNQRLLPMFGLEGDAVLAYDNPVPRNRQLELTERQSAVAGGWMTPNEARESQGLDRNDDPEADRLHVNGQPLGMAAAPMPLGASAAVPETATAAPIADKASEASDASEPLRQALGAAETKVLIELASQARQGTISVASARAIASTAFPHISPEMLAAMFSSDESMPVSASDRSPVNSDSVESCVSGKIPKLLAEGHSQEQALAIAYAMCGEGKSKGCGCGCTERKALEDIDTKPPQSVADNAAMALRVRAEKPPSERGMTEVGIARARDLANRVNLSEETIRRMLAYFERHQSDKQGQTWDEQGAGWQAWNGWGGDEGWAWARRKVEQFDREREQSKSISHASVWTKASTGDLVDDDLLKRWLSSVEGVLKEQVEAAVKAIRLEQTPNAATIDTVVSLMRRSRWDRDLVEALSPYIRRSLEHGAAVGMEALAKVAGSPAVAQIGWSSEQIREYADRTSVRLAVGAADSVNRHTEVAFRELLGASVEDGDTTDQMAARVQEWAGRQRDPERSTRSRALTIARTEAARAAATAEQDAWRETGLVSGKTWLLAPDPCEFCAAVAKQFGKDGVGLDEPFLSKGSTVEVGDKTMRLDYDDVGGPPLHPNCRCAVQPVLVEDYRDIAEEAIRRVRGEKPREIRP